MTERISRRVWLARTAGLALALSSLARGLAAYRKGVPMVVYKDPGCGCCEKWVGIMQTAGFEVSVRNSSDLDPIKRRYGVPAALASCHTAVTGGYVIEGHVPADLVLKLLKEKPVLVGLAVPGMVTGSPGMEGPNPQVYQILSFDRSGRSKVYARR